jgi:hypothetical protein
MSASNRRFSAKMLWASFNMLPLWGIEETQIRHRDGADNCGILVGTES